MTYTINIDKPALRLFQQLSPEVQRCLITEAQILAVKPFAGEPLHRKLGLLYQLHRTFKKTKLILFYQVFQAQEIVVVRLATTREAIYKKLEQMR